MKKVEIYHNGLILTAYGTYQYKQVNKDIRDPEGKIVPLLDELIPAISTINKRHEHLKCPAVTQWYKNTWIVSQPLDVNIIYNSKTHKLSTNADKLFDLRPIRKASERSMTIDEEIPSEEENFYPEAQFHCGYLFWTKFKNIWIEMTPHPDAIKLGLELTPATYPISDWTRPTTFAFLIKKKDSVINIPKGTGLYYIRFVSRKYYDINVDLKLQNMPRSIFLRSFFDTSLKYLVPWYSWSLIKKRLDKQSKCPFLKFWENRDKEDKIII